MNEALLARFQQAYQDLDLFPLLEPDEIERFRVDYGRGTLVRLKREIEASEKDGKAVFTGHRGCGKSTLLKRLAVEMGQREHFVVLFSISDLIEMSAVSHTNILYAIALMLLNKATQVNIPIPSDIQQKLLGWKETTQKTSSEQVVKTEFSVNPGELIKIIQAKLQQEKSFREQVERVYEKRLSDLVGMANRIAAAISTTTQRQVLVIIDDLDKLDLELVESIYRNNVKSLFSPGFRIVFTIPIAAARDPMLSGMLMSEGIGRIQILPVAKFFGKTQRHDAAAEPDHKVFDIFLKVLSNRLPEDLVEPTTAERMVLLSGGVMRELMRIARECCTECMVEMEIDPERQDIKINDQILQTAVRNLRNDFARPLGEKLYQLLVSVYQTAEPEDAASDEFLNLLHGLYVLEYLNDDLWFAVHPIVVDLLKRRELVS